MSVTETDSPVAVLGAGSWGTALAIQFARSGRPTRLWGRNRAALAAMARERRNERYLAAGTFPPSLSVEPELTDALRGACDVLIAVPSHALRSLLGSYLVPVLISGGLCLIAALIVLRIGRGRARLEPAIAT